MANEDNDRARLAALRADPLLADVPEDATLEEIRTLAAFETGQALKVGVLRFDGERIGAAGHKPVHPRARERGVRDRADTAPRARARPPARPPKPAKRQHAPEVVVRQGATVRQFKRALARQVERRPDASLGRRGISWSVSSPPLGPSCPRGTTDTRRRSQAHKRLVERSRQARRLCALSPPPTPHPRLPRRRPYIWRRYWLACAGKRLEPDDARVHDLGVRTGSDIVFLRRLRDRPRQAERRAARRPVG